MMRSVYLLLSLQKRQCQYCCWILAGRSGKTAKYNQPDEWEESTYECEKRIPFEDFMGTVLCSLRRCHTTANRGCSCADRLRQMLLSRLGRNFIVCSVLWFIYSYLFKLHEWKTTLRYWIFNIILRSIRENGSTHYSQCTVLETITHIVQEYDPTSFVGGLPAT